MVVSSQAQKRPGWFVSGCRKCQQRDPLMDSGFTALINHL